MDAPFVQQRCTLISLRLARACTALKLIKHPQGFGCQCGEAAIAAPCHAGGGRMSGFTKALRRGADQRGQLVRQDLGGHIDQACLLAEAGDGFEVVAVLEPLECLFNRERPAVPS